MEHTFVKIFGIEETGERVCAMLTGHYSPDTITDVPKAIHAYAESNELRLNEYYEVTLLYLGPDEIPSLWLAVFPNGCVARVLNVNSGMNYRFLTPAVAYYVEIMERAQNLIRRGIMPGDVAVFLWSIVRRTIEEHEELGGFIHCYRGFLDDLTGIHFMVREQAQARLDSVFGPGPHRFRDPIAEKYEELGLNPSDFG